MNLDGEDLYRMWWQEMWATPNEKPQPQWEQLTDERKDPWHRLAHRLRGDQPELLPDGRRDVARTAWGDYS